MAKPGEVPTPECDKMRAVHDKSQAIGAFLEWLQGKYTFARYHKHTDACVYDDDVGERGCYIAEGSLVPHRINIEKTLADYFEIDLNKVDSEKRAILEALRP